MEVAMPRRLSRISSDTQEGSEELTDDASSPDASTITSRQDGWPVSPLGAVDRAFNLLVAPPTRYVLDGTAFTGLPDVPIGLDRLRQLLLSRQVSRPVRDAVWRELVTRGRTSNPEGQAWTVIAAGMA